MEKKIHAFESEIFEAFRSNEKKMDKAKDTLKDNGYYCDNLWHVDDVKQNYPKCSTKEALEVLDDVMTSDYIQETIYSFIDKKLNK
jgi:hypothetical protein|tara:strand:- start:677 stop:934 length:258 start_codon:yes stop_codon:yes gene_type:complete